MSTPNTAVTGEGNAPHELAMSITGAGREAILAREAGQSLDPATFDAENIQAEAEFYQGELEAEAVQEKNINMNAAREAGQIYRIVKKLGGPELCKDGKTRHRIPTGQGLSFPTVEAAQAVCPKGFRIVEVTLHNQEVA